MYLFTQHKTFSFSRVFTFCKDSKKNFSVETLRENVKTPHTSHIFFSVQEISIISIPARLLFCLNSMFLIFAFEISRLPILYPQFSEKKHLNIYLNFSFSMSFLFVIIFLHHNIMHLGTNECLLISIVVFHVFQFSVFLWRIFS